MSNPRSAMMSSTSASALTRPQLPNRNESQNPQSPQSEAAADTITSTNDAAAHVDAINWDAPFEAETVGDGVAETAGDSDGAPGLIDKEIFWQNFRGLFAIGGVIPVAPFPLKSLPIQPDEEAAARGASDALYDICAETPFLRFLLAPESEWAKRGFAILAFVGPKLAMVRAELTEKVQAEMSAREARAERPMRDVTPAPVVDPARDPQAL